MKLKPAILVGLLALCGCTGTTPDPRSGSTPGTQTRAILSMVADEIEYHYAVVGRFPETLSKRQFSLSSETAQQIPVDEWGNLIAYRTQGSDRVLISSGVDRKADTADDIITLIMEKRCITARQQHLARSEALRKRLEDRRNASDRNPRFMKAREAETNAVPLPPGRKDSY